MLREGEREAKGEREEKGGKIEFERHENVWMQGIFHGTSFCFFAFTMNLHH
jgi:hypothetical protein